jgi:hypothetical protein
MAKFLTIGYGDEAGYQQTAESVKAAAHEHDAWLAARGSIVGIAGTPIQVRNPGASGVRTQIGAFLRSDLPIAGFAIIDAADANEAVSIISGTPCAVANGVVEVWPLLSTPNGD